MSLPKTIGLLALFLPACSGGDLIKVAVSPSAVAAVNDGQTATQIVATVTASGQLAPDGTSVVFTVDTSTSASLAPFVAGQPPVQTSTVQTASGKATVSLYDLADEAVSVQISAQIMSSGGANYTIAGSTSVTFGGKCKDAELSAAPQSLQSGVPATVTLNCDSSYMGGIFPFDQATVQLFTGNTQGCLATVNDASQQGVSGAAVQFLSEAGTFETDVVATGQHPTELTDTTGVAHVSYHVSQPYPEDVPWTTLDGYLGQSQKRAWTDITGHTYNPRDGWVTLIAAVSGVPSGPVSEPFVDSNDNGQWDLGEPYIDVNCNGQFDAQQTPDTNGLVRIWTSKTIVWTDGVWNASSCSAMGCTGTGIVSTTCLSPIGAGQSCNVVARFMDKNLNLLSTYVPSGDNVINATTTGAVEVNPATLPNDPGLNSKALVQPADFTFTLTDTTPTGGMNVVLPYSLSIAGTFVFGDTSNSVNTQEQLVLEQTFSVSQTGSATSPPN